MKDKAKLFLKDGTPKYIACYETKRNPTLDRFCVVFTRLAFHDKAYRGLVTYRAMSTYPCAPQGFGQWGEAKQGEFRAGGSKIKFSELPVDCQRLIIADYCAMWDIEMYEVYTEGDQVRLQSIYEVERSA
jgi:hypothetical protein